MKKSLLILAVMVLIVLLTGTVQAGARAPLNAQPDATARLDFDCDGLVTVADIGAVATRAGSTIAAERWLYDLDADGVIGAADVRIVAAHWNAAVELAPLWCN